MKRWLRNLAIGAGIAVAGLGAYAPRAYKDYKTPETITSDVLSNGSVMNIFRSKENFVFDNLEELLGKYDKNPCTIEERGFRYSNIDVMPVEQRAKRIVNDWARYEKNTQDRSDNWNASDQVVYNFLKNSKELYKGYIDEKLKIIRGHELIHLNSKYPLNTKESELEAYWDSLKNSPLAMEDLLLVYSDKKVSGKHVANYEAAKEILSEFLKYPDTQGFWELTHLKNFNEEIPKRAKEIKSKFLGNKT